MMTVKKVAERAGVSPALVYAWVQDGILPHLRLGKKGSRGTIRIQEVDLAEFLASKKRGDGPQEAIPEARRRRVILKHLKLRSY